MNKICYGCGAKLQTEDKEKIGYVPLNKSADAKYCMRCFRLMHYGEQAVNETPKDVKEIVNKINKDVRFVVFLVDFINLNKEVVEIFKSIRKRKVLIVNKCEMIPDYINKERIVDYIHDYYGISDDIRLKGGKNSHGAKSVLNYLEKSDIHEAYILGISNSGKSTLINDLMEICDSKTSKIVVNSKANTTLDFIRVKLNDELTLIDSPGFILNNALNHDVTGKDIKAYAMQMKECETASLLDNKYFLKFEVSTPFTFFTSSDAKKVVKKYFKAADGLVNKIEVKAANTDIVLIGLGFITIKKPTVITTNVDLKNIEVRPSMFGGYNQ